MPSCPSSPTTPWIWYEQKGRVAISRAGKGFLVCAYSDGEARPGLLKSKVRDA